MKLEDAGAALMAMAYVDLNQVRACKEATLEASQHSSIQYRLHALELERSGRTEALDLSVAERRALEMNRVLCPVEQLFSLMGWTEQDLKW
ncbi:hypothetical protein RZS08_55035, partial [Arthrospira platensis SPKY1]|nr:hypothetical protein [Arthrospira platensis SPKY1]